jgi:hypothetical protein
LSSRFINAVINDSTSSFCLAIGAF